LIFRHFGGYTGRASNNVRYSAIYQPFVPVEIEDLNAKSDGFEPLMATLYLFRYNKYKL